MLKLNNHIKTQSCLHEKIWSLYETDQEAFNAAAVDYFNKTYPNLTPVKFNYAKRIVWLA